jgi:hypothetical protein
MRANNCLGPPSRLCHEAQRIFGVGLLQVLLYTTTRSLVLDWSILSLRWSSSHDRCKFLATVDTVSILRRICYSCCSIT